ncbi:MAG: hypothetical protein IT358_11750 [Gemmatimonadaceae bacterium]|nr:hypothetical protein [Gemmatimonadota bacterium]MCC7324501.1 hypothetical protein [Gemmatimonadaceae bacterium]
MRRLLYALMVVGSFLSAALLPAQDVERPVALDAAGRVMAMTPALAARLKLTAPAWPVSGDFVEARLFDRGGSGFVLVVQRARDVNERYLLTNEQRVALQEVLTSALATAGNLSTGERQDLISEPAKGQFVRDQTLAAALVYGPALASLTDNGSTGTAVYLATVGATFFTSANLAKNRSISKAQNHMATNGTWRGGLIANGLLYVAAGDDVSGDIAAATSLLGAIGGSIIGFHAGRPLTDSEAHGATFGSTVTAMTTAGLLGSFGAFQGNQSRAEVAGLIGAALVGYPIGLRYVRRASYTVTAGDVTTMTMGTLLGVVGAAALLPESTDSEQAVAAVLTAGLLGGTIMGDRVFVRRYDFTQSQGRQMGLGALAGGLMGIALPLAAESDNGQAYFAGAAIGGVVGMAITKGLIDPAKGGARLSSNSGVRNGRPDAADGNRASLASNPAIRLHPENLSMLFARSRNRRVNVPLVSLAF